MRRASCLAKSVVLANLFWAATALAESLSPGVGPTPDPCAFFSPNQKHVDFFINMSLGQKKVAVSVPKIFLEDRWDHVNEANHNSQLFRVTLDTFEPVSRKQASLQNRNGIHNRMTFVVGDRVDHEALDSNVLRRADPGTEGSAFNEYKLESSEHGLFKAVSKGDDPQGDVFFSLTDSGVPDTIISCWIVGKVPFPGCEQYFRAAGMDIKVNYRAFAFENWRKVQDDITRFLSCAVEASNNKDI